MILDKLLEGLSNSIPDILWQKKIIKCHDTYLDMIREERYLLGKPIPPQKAVSILNDIIPEDAIITIDSGAFMHWFDRGFIFRGRR